MDKDEFRAKQLIDIFKSTNPEERPLAYVKLQILGACIVSSLGIAIESLGLEFLTNESVEDYYQAAMRVMEECIGM